uniref:Protein kinase domain-containing protein n=1 Tax=Triticum urartu TaxID=4572 RepID=A0A8R7QDL4_TRIUA
MGCSFSGLNALYDTVGGGGGDIWVNDYRFRVLRRLGDAGPAGSSVFLVKEVVAAAAVSDGTAGAGPGAAGLAKKKGVDPSHISADGTYALKKVLIQSDQHLELVRQEIRVSSQFSHPNLLPLLENAIIAVKGVQDGSQNHEAYLLFPVHLDGTLQDVTKSMQEKKEYLSTITILQIFRQLCAGLKHMHSFEPPYAHNGVKPDNVLITQRKEQPHLAILMDFESARPARRAIRSQAEALQLQEWASEHCSAHFRAPELWECPPHADIDERTDVWSLGCTLYAMMYGKSPFDYELDESAGESLVTVIKSAQPHPAVRPNIDDIIIHVDKLIAKHST